MKIIKALKPVFFTLALLLSGGAGEQTRAVILVRKGNPKGIKNWDDLVKEGVSVITPNPKHPAARYNYLAAWAFAEKSYGSKDAARDFIKKLYKNVLVVRAGPPQPLSSAVSVMC